MPFCAARIGYIHSEHIAALEHDFSVVQTNEQQNSVEDSAGADNIELGEGRSEEPRVSAFEGQEIPF